MSNERKIKRLTKVIDVIGTLALTALKYVCNNTFFKSKSSHMSLLALSASFEYLCYGYYGHCSFLFFFSAGTVFIRQNLTSTDVRL